MIAEALAAATHRLQQAQVPDARLDAELILSHLLQADRAQFVLRRKERLSEGQARAYLEAIVRRERREPLQHILGVQEFFGLPIKVDSRVLVPRPETELLVETVLGLDLPMGATVADLGTGSGCIPIALGVHRSDLELHGLDRSAEALALAEENAILHRLSERIALHQGNLASPPGRWKGRLDAVVSNPPYVSESEWEGLQPEVREHDPRIALVSGPTGFEAYAALAPVARELLKPGGWLVTELGFGQAEGVRELVELAGLELVEIKPDLHQIPRVLVARKKRSIPTSF